MASTKTGRGRYNGQNIGLPRISSLEGTKRRMEARVTGSEKLVANGAGAYTRPGSRNRKKVGR